ncbi:MAG: ATP-binding protein [Bacteroidales bacterium]|nr:ATP-binding protein [Bacteroidales bacterium]
MILSVKPNPPEARSGGVIEADDITRFQRALSMLADSLSELRNVARHIMPETLTRYGVKTALSDLCHALPSVEFHHSGDDRRLDSKLEILLYRAAHELINNALKHAEATHINVRLLQTSDHISLTIHDNGKGFAPATTIKGTGLEKIRNNAAAHNGKLLIHSTIGKGTEIELKIEN